MSGGIEDMYAEDTFAEKLKAALDKAPYADHYRKRDPEPITVIESWGLGFHLGNALKYIARADFKGSKKQDLEKAVWYLKREIAKC